MTDGQKRQIVRAALIVVLMIAAWAVDRFGTKEPPAPQVPPTASTPAPSKPVPAATSASAAKPATKSSPLVVKNLTLRDEDGRTLYKGEIDLGPTVARIEAGRKLRFAHDGSTFQNREGRLPREAPGYYQEWVVPTPGDDGPGPQRLVTGEQGEVWYTADHYRSFRRIPYTLKVP